MGGGETTRLLKFLPSCQTRVSANVIFYHAYAFVIHAVSPSISAILYRWAQWVFLIVCFLNCALSACITLCRYN